jgi:ribonuclease G
VNKELIIRSNSSAVDFALLKDGKLIELNKEVDSNKFSVGDIYVAKIRKPVKGTAEPRTRKLLRKRPEG